MHAVKLADGAEYRCADDDTLLRAGLRAGLGFPYECNAGSCGTCKVELIEGQVTSLRPDAPGLSDRDRAKNRVLACQSRPASDCAIKVRLRPENVPHHRPARFTARLEGFRDLTHDMREFRFSSSKSPGFLPGQYALFYLPGLDAPRTYSVSNVDEGRGEWEFVVRRVPTGVGTMTLFDRVPVGSEITLDGPYGLAYLRADSPRDLVLVGGGSGLAPMLSLARGAVREPKLAGRNIHVFYGARSARDLAGEAEIAALPGYGERLFFQQVLSEPEPGTWSGPTGFVHEHVRGFVGERWPEFEYYFAGPPLMAQAVQQMLIEKRVPFPQVHFDSFY
ncbi:MAG TPA: 2Fe-2S iron-sulfur cluster-binding protein [Usitatibacter sp.]|jgi:toluene monooxygenase electron transfer component|nr:2Fe-2S iron-sulfur cluster-binding protein [Usitatibacter sp.]